MKYVNKLHTKYVNKFKSELKKNGDILKKRNSEQLSDFQSPPMTLSVQSFAVYTRIDSLLHQKNYFCQ